MSDHTRPRRGDQFQAMDCIATVRRVSVMRWADIHVRQIGTGVEWSKRQSLPLPSDWIKLHAPENGDH